jgi:hypothetical protein
MRIHPGVARDLGTCGLLVLALAGAASAQSPVTISFRATGENGQPVLDLKAADLTIKVDGKPRAIKSLDVVRIGGTPGVSRPSRPAFASNTAADTGRDIIIVLDDESIAPGKEAVVKDALRLLVKNTLAADRIGMLSLRSGGLTIAATTDRAKIAAGIEGLRGEARVNESTADFQCRTSQILTSVKELLANATDAKTTFVLVSSGIAPLPPDQSRTQLGTSSGLCQLRPPHFTEVGQAAAGSAAALYVVYAVDGRATPSSDAQAGLESLAGVTTAATIRLAGNSLANMNRITDETAAYYVASFDVSAADRNGSAHKVEVHANRTGARLKAGGDLLLAKAGTKQAPKDMLRSADSYRDLPLRATGWPMRDAGNKLKVMALFEPSDSGVTLASAMVALIDGNRIAAQWTAQAAELGKVPVLAALLAPPGNYRLRVAATDSTGRAGTVDYPLEAQLGAAGTMTMSGLTIGLADAGFKPRVVFGPGDQGALGYLELYGVPKGAAVSGSIELAPTEQAPAIGTTQAAVKETTTEDMRIVAGGFSIAGLAPGDYVMRMIISVDGKVVGTAMRTLSKSAR